VQNRKNLIHDKVCDLAPQRKSFASGLAEADRQRAQLETGAGGLARAWAKSSNPVAKYPSDESWYIVAETSINGQPWST
jgi:hypothetical protein